MHMKYTTEFDAYSFPFWGPAKAIVDEIAHANAIEGLQEMVETAFFGETPTKTQINNFVWVESDMILSQLGLRN